MSNFAGTTALVRFTIRRERVRMAVWVTAIVAMVGISADGVTRLFVTQADLDQAAAASTNPAFLALQGPALALDTLGGQVVFQLGAPSLVIVALMGMFMIGRITRGEEESGRLELVRSLPVGRNAPMVAGMIVVAAMCAIVGAGVTLVLVGQGFAALGSATLGVSYGLLALVFAAVGIVAAQVSENTRVVYGLAGAVLAFAYIVRALGDGGIAGLRWMSPIGWMQQARPFADERWWPLLPALGLVVVLPFVANSMAARRNLGSGLIAARPGPRAAGRLLSSPLGLAVRLQRGSLIGWSLIIIGSAATYGAIANSINQFVSDNEALADILTGGSTEHLISSFLGTSIRMLALIAGGFAVQSTLRIHSEETSQRCDPILSTQVSRLRWATSHLAMAAGGTVVVLAGAGLSIGVAAGITLHDVGLVGRLVTTSLSYAPALWLIIGFAMAVIGLAPRAAAASWAVLGVAAVVTLLGPLLQLPNWATDLSPFTHVTLSPDGATSLGPLAILTALAMSLIAVGLRGLSRRDIA